MESVNKTITCTFGYGLKHSINMIKLFSIDGAVVKDDVVMLTSVPPTCMTSL